jgi:hypothetical protein
MWQKLPQFNEHGQDRAAGCTPSFESTISLPNGVLYEVQLGTEMQPCQIVTAGKYCAIAS